MTALCLTQKLRAIGTALSIVIGPCAFAQQPTTAADPTVLDVHAGQTVHATQLPERIYLRDANDPDDIIWARIPAYRTLLSAAPPVHRSTALRFEPKEAVNLYFQVARTSERLYVRLRWQDPTQNRKTSVDAFSDGAAIQWALNGADTSYMMGSGPKKPVNIWYWRADHEAVENLAAGGFGSTTHLTEQPVTGNALYDAKRNERDSEWHVVMSRPLVSKGKYQANLQKGTIPVAFALWQGQETQRDGNKRVSHGWILVNVRPAPPTTQQPGQRSRQSAKALKAADAKTTKSKTANLGVKSKDAPAAGTFY